ncbi:MAG: 30S ribosomal protein S12 methylthiotransferase RimO, partial [Bacteroidales bacterium]
DVLSLMAQEPKICQYVDIPLQHVSDKVLSAMRRNTTGAQTRELIEKFRIQVPGICLRTTFMVGHPGEDSAAFNELLDFVAEARFERMGAFMYSQEEGTYGAMNLEDRITEKVKASRYKRLMELQQDISYRYNLSRIGKTYRILVDSVLSGGEEVPGTVALGRTMYEAPEVDGQVIIENSVNLQEGVFAQAEIVGANEYDLYAKIK